MSASLQAVEPVEPDPIATAIAALTAAARRTRVRGAGTEHATVEPVDFGEIACHVITAVAANIGGVEDLLAGRPGSWEAGYVRQIVLSTAGDAPDALLGYRTEPVRLPFNAESAFDDLGLMDLYDHDLDAANQRVDDLDAQLFAAVATPEERTRLDEIQAAMPSWSEPHAATSGLVHWHQLAQEARAIYDRITARAEAAGEPLLAALTSAHATVTAIEALWAQDLAAYTEAYSATATRYLTARGASIGVELIPYTGEIGVWDDLTYAVDDYAQAYTPLPMTGEAPDHSDGVPADALRRAHLTYADRARQA